MPDQPIINTFLILILSVVIIGGMLYALKKYIEKNKNMSNNAHIKIISKQPVAPKASLMVIETEERRFLIGLAEKNISLISELNPSDNNHSNNNKKSSSFDKSVDNSDLSFKNFLKSTISKS